MRHEVKVACNGCTACCKWGPVALHPALGDRVADYGDDVIANEFGAFLKVQADGSCIYLKEDGCSIYDKRPGVCRAFDCRRYVELDPARTDPHFDPRVWAAGLLRTEST